MKRFVSLVTGMALSASVFALKIPTGDNVRAADVKQNGNAIVEVTLGGDTPVNITTSIGVVQAKAGSVVYFYDKSVLKELTTIEQNVTTSIGTVKVKGGGKMTFYESGALATLSPAEQTLDLPPLKAVKLSASRDMTFYESGKLKEVSLYEKGQTLETPIGTFNISKRSFSEEDPSSIGYYKSGSPMIMYVKAYKAITVGGTEYFCHGYDGYNHFYPIEFHDSGSSDKWLVKSLSPGRYSKDETVVSSVAYESKIGKIEIALNPSGSKCPVRITFDKDGNVLSAPLYKSPDFTVKVNGEDVYIKGGKYEQVYWDEYGKKKIDTLCSISFYDDASTIKSCVLDDLVITEVGGIKFKMPAGTEVGFWNNGNIKKCSSSEPTALNINGKPMSIEADRSYLFHRNGKFWAVETRHGFVDTFYGDGALKRVINVCDNYSNSGNKSWYSALFLSPNGYRIVEIESREPGDLGRNVSMVFFDDNDKPSSYTMFKLDKNGNYILDDEGLPIEDPTKKKFRTAY